MSWLSEDVLFEAALTLASLLIVMGLWSLFVWANNWYAIRRGGSLLKYGLWRLFFTSILVVLALTIFHSFKK